jgi:U3 small nucleolar RNA-associated protein MPP10
MNGHIGKPNILVQCLETLNSAPHLFLQPTSALHFDTLALAKHYLDPVAFAVSTLQSERLNILRQSRKRKRGKQEQEKKPLRLKSVATEGFSAQQVWEQISRIAEAVEKETTEFIENLAEDSSEDPTEEYLQSDRDFHEDEVENSAVDVAAEEQEDDDSEMEDLGDDTEEEEEDDEVDIYSELEDEEDNGKNQKNPQPKKTRKDKFGLNDDFFSIDEFNRRTEMLERQDANGEADIDAASDEEDVEWEANPMSVSLPPDEAEEESNDDDEKEGGPTFGNMDLMAPEGASDEDNDDLDLDGIETNMHANNMMYDDFFGTPKQKKKSSKKSKDLSKSRGPETERFDYEKDIERAMASTHHDIFLDDDAAEEEDNLNPNASNHERRRAGLLAQIRELEAINISQRPWVLAGEAQAKDRPVNALLEEELDFENAGKPLPVVTAEMSEDTVQMIKRRIIAREFQEVRKRRPDEALMSMTRRGRVFDEPFDIAQKKERKGLAEVYEEEHLKRTDPAYVDKKTEALNKDHAEIETLWKDVVTKLDSLASWRYRPKPTEVTISVRSDAPAMILEDARPSGVGGDVGHLSQLAPQEIYRSGEMKEQGKVTLKGGTVVDRMEMSQENRRRLRRREKERIKKAQGQAPEKKSKTHSVVTDLKKNNVKVIGRRGDVRDVDGQEVKEGPRILGSALKL